MSELTDRYVISREEFLKIMATQEDFLKQQLADKPTSITPHLWIETTDLAAKREVQLCALMVPFNEANEKEQALVAQAARLHRERKIPVAVFLTVEAWVSQQPVPGVEPRHSSDRREVVLVGGCSLNGEICEVSSVLVKRDEKNRMIAQGPLERVSHARLGILQLFYRAFALGIH
jgi:sRNA-binding regulator protein Hfq